MNPKIALRSEQEDKQPITFNVAFSTILQGSFELMIFIFWRPFFRIDQTKLWLLLSLLYPFS